MNGRRKIATTGTAMLLAIGGLTGYGLHAAPHAMADSEGECAGPYPMDWNGTDYNAYHLCAAAIGTGLHLKGGDYTIQEAPGHYWRGVVTINALTIVGGYEARKASTHDLFVSDDSQSGHVSLNWTLPSKGKWCIRATGEAGYANWGPVCGIVHK